MARQLEELAPVAAFDLDQQERAGRDRAIEDQAHSVGRKIEDPGVLIFQVLRNIDLAKGRRGAAIADGGPLVGGVDEPNGEIGRELGLRHKGLPESKTQGTTPTPVVK